MEDQASELTPNHGRPRQVRRLHFQVGLDEDLIEAIEVCVEKRVKKYGKRHPKATKAAVTNEALRQLVKDWAMSRHGEPSVYLVPVDGEDTARADIHLGAVLGAKRREGRP